jgi:hypothetical protein
MANRSQSYYETERKRKGEDQILSILQFFYIVRLGQQGLFSIIEQEEPPVDIDSLTNICDQLVGSSLYAAKDPSMNNRSRHKNKLFDILHKLENGVDEPVYDGANTTFKQVKRLVDQIWKNTKDEKSVMQQYSRLPKQDDNEPPTWIVMPYKSMMADLSSQIHLKKDDEGEEIKQDSEKISDDVAHDEPKQDKSAINQNDQDASLSKVEANMEANVDVKDAEDENNENDDEDGTSAMQEEAKVVSDTDKQGKLDMNISL